MRQAPDRAPFTRDRISKRIVVSLVAGVILEVCVLWQRQAKLYAGSKA